MAIAAGEAMVRHIARLQPLSPIQNNSDLAQGLLPIRPSKVRCSDIYLAPGGVHGTETKTSHRIYRRDGSCDSVDHPGGHDVGGGCAELVSDLPPSTFAFVLRRSTSFLPPTLESRSVIKTCEDSPVRAAGVAARVSRRPASGGHSASRSSPCGRVAGRWPTRPATIADRPTRTPASRGDSQSGSWSRSDGRSGWTSWRPRGRPICYPQRYPAVARVCTFAARSER